MKLAVDCRMSGKSGIGSYFDSLIPFFIKNYECFLFGSENQIKNFRTYGNFDFLPCDTETFSLKEIFRFPKEVLSKINSCDFYYSPYCNVPGGIHIPVFTTIHDVVFLDIPLASRAGTLARKIFYLRACSKSKLVFTVSRFSEERIRHHLHTKKPVVVTYNASDPMFSKPEASIIKEKNTMLFVGNIKKHKGLHVLLEAFRYVLEKKPESKLIIVGNANNFRTGDDTVVSEIQKFGDRISFTGFISDDDLKALYTKVSLLVQPSFYEGFGMPPLEALNSGTNVVLSDIPVFKELYSDFPVTFFKTGDSRDLSEKIISALEQPAPENIPERFSFQKTFNIIKENIK